MRYLVSILLIFSFVSCNEDKVQKQYQNSSEEMMVYKNPNCGCCTKWVEHMRENGYKVVEKAVDNLEEIKNKLGVPKDKRSCHTGVMKNFVFEGHIPADSIKAFMKDPKGKRGLVVPDMPMGSPGMDFGHEKENYDVLSFDKSGKTMVYRSY